MRLTSKEARELLEQERKSATNDKWIDHCIYVDGYKKYLDWIKEKRK